MAKINLSVVIHNQTGVFYPGQVVRGKVQLTINEDLKVSGLDATLKGRSRVRWSEGAGQHERVYWAKEQYVKDKLNVLTLPPGESNTILKASTYEYPFKFTLPKQLPSSYKDEIGFVRYQVKARLNKTWSLNSYAKRIFILVNPLDLNTLPDLLKPVRLEKSKQLCCLCCASSPIHATMEVKNRIGYVPGETIEFNADISNESGRNMKESVGRLVMVVQYHAKTKTTKVEYVLTREKQGRIKPGGTDSWRNGRFHIPAVPPSFLQYCSIIDINYYAQLKVKPRGPASSLKVPIEVVIGSIPLHQVVAQYSMSMPSEPSTLAEPMGLYTDTSMPANMPNATFAQSALTTGDKDFTPVFTYYNWGCSTQD